MAIVLDSQLKKPGERQEISRHDIVREELPGLRTFPAKRLWDVPSGNLT